MTSMTATSQAGAAESITGFTGQSPSGAKATFSDGSERRGKAEAFDTAKAVPYRAGPFKTICLGVRTVSPLRGSGRLFHLTQRFRAGLISTARFAGWIGVAPSTSSSQTERSRTHWKPRPFRARSAYRFKANYTYRGLLCGATLLCLLGLAAGAAAQTAPPKKKPRSARAVALIEWKKDAKGVLAPRLLPISLLWEGRYYDAGLYEASPRPMALEPGTIYEATRAGVPAGLFTVRGAFEVKDVWYGDGIWSPGVTTSAKSADGEDERPRLKRGGAASASAPEPANTPTSSATEPEAVDPNRPKLQRGQPSAAGASSASLPPRPLPPAPKAPAVAGSGAPTRTGESPVPTRPRDATAPLVAVSDEQAADSRPYLFQWNRDEEERLTGELKALAAAEVARRAGGVSPALEEAEVRAFDLNTDNLAELVLSARTAAGKTAPQGLQGRPRIYYVTVVARMTVSGELRKLFASVTSSSWLGSVPRLELVDAVDADGDGNGELLFAQVTETGRGYGLYRVGKDELFPLVETGPVPSE